MPTRHGPRLIGDRCAWCGQLEAAHGSPGESDMGGSQDRLCPGDVTSQFFTLMPVRDDPIDHTCGDIRVLEIGNTTVRVQCCRCGRVFTAGR